METKVCQGCGLDKPWLVIDNGFDNGSAICIDGGYSLFHDDVENGCLIKLELCHECSLSLFRSIPVLSERKGLHSVSINNPQYPLCCEFSWSIENGEVIYGTKEDSEKELV